MNVSIIQKINWEKGGGLIPAIIQDLSTQQVLMLGFMTPQALEQTLETKQVTFYSRTKKRLWQKGETSGNCLHVKEIKLDCDQDTLLILAEPTGPICHLGAETCFGDPKLNNFHFLNQLETLIEDRKQNLPENSYTTTLFKEGIDQIAQKVGEEAVEVVLASVKGSNEDVLNEAADLLYHLLVLLNAKELSLNDVVLILKRRH